MIDRKRLIKAWEIFRDSNPYQICSGKEFRAIKEPEYCMGQMIEDTLKLLKEQEPVKPVIKQEMNDVFSWIDDVAYCGNCGDRIGCLKRHYCSRCGREVKWE